MDVYFDYLIGDLQAKEQFAGRVDVLVRRNVVLYQNLSLYVGDNKTYVVYVKDSDGKNINVSGAVGLLTWKRRKEDVDVVLHKSTSIIGEGEIGAANKGELVFYLEPSDTENLESERQYVWDIGVQLSDGKKYTVLEGVTTLKKTVN